MRFIDFFWWLLDGDRSSREIIEAKQRKPLQQEADDVFIDCGEMDDIDCCDFDEFCD